MEDFIFSDQCEGTKCGGAGGRQIEIIAEAAKRLGEMPMLSALMGTGKGFCRMADVLRHGYHKIDDGIVWNTLKDELPAMRAAALKALKTL